MNVPDLQTFKHLLDHAGWPGVLLAVLGASCFYMLPSLVGLARGHRRIKALTVANLVSGWSLAIWCGLMAWALTKGSGPQLPRRPRAGER